MARNAGSLLHKLKKSPRIPPHERVRILGDFRLSGLLLFLCVFFFCEEQFNIFLDTHREEITLHKVAKAAFDETGLKKLPKVKALNAEYSDLLTQKKAAYPDYRKAREEMQELVKAQKNIELFFTEEKDAQEKQQTR